MAGTRVPITLGGHAQAKMESEEGTAFESLPRREHCCELVWQPYGRSVVFRSTSELLVIRRLDHWWRVRTWARKTHLSAPGRSRSGAEG